MLAQDAARRIGYGGVPDLHGGIKAAGDGNAVARQECEAVDLCDVAVIFANLPPFLQIPEPHDCILAAGKRHLAVMRKCQGSDAGVGGVQAELLGLIGNVPELDIALKVSGKNALAVGREDGYPYLFGVSGETARLLAGGGIPEANGLVIAG